MITIFTPTYNRAHTLPKLYDSLCKQTCKAFEWIIVDDGSIDNTYELVTHWQDEKKVKILYERQCNGGKMRAHNRGVQLANGNLFLCVDSDDYLSENAVELLLKQWDSTQEKCNIAGIIAYKAFKTDGLYKLLAEFPVDITVASLTDLFNKGFRVDTSIIFRTSVIRQYPFPEIDGEKFITEAYVYDQIDQKYKYYLFAKVIILCEYMNDGYTSNFIKVCRENPKGYALYYNQKVKFCRTGLKSRLKYLVYYIAYSRYANLNDVYRDSNIKGLLYMIAYMVSLYYYRILTNRFSITYENN
jgi:glycosyltransferase involved in cell wall biosynthesis